MPLSRLASAGSPLAICFELQMAWNAVVRCVVTFFLAFSLDSHSLCPGEIVVVLIKFRLMSASCCLSFATIACVPSRFSLPDQRSMWDLTAFKRCHFAQGLRDCLLNLQRSSLSLRQYLWPSSVFPGTSETPFPP